MEPEPFTVFLEHPARPEPLSLKRAPVFLRFVLKGDDWKTLDALDQLSDEPADGERVIVAERKNRSVVFMDGTTKGGGRRRGWVVVWWYYHPVLDPPAAEVAGNTASWRAWCVERMKSRKAANTNPEVTHGADASDAVHGEARPA